MIIGVDAGTSVVKAVAFSDDGAVLRVAARPTRTLTPAPGHAEQDLEEVMAAVGAVVREVSAGDAPLLVGITAQGDGVWLLDEEGHAVRAPILWSDARAAGVLAEWLRNGTADQGFRYCGSVLFPGAAAPLLAYLQEHEPESLAAASTAGYCKDAILQRLTGARVTDISDASLPFFDPRLRDYHEQAFTLYGVETWRHLLPPVDPTPAPLRALSSEGAVLTGLPAGTPIHAGPFDLAATMLGAGVTRLGDGLVILGTTLGCAVLVDDPGTDGVPAGMLLCTPEPDRWVRVMPAMVGTPSLEWILGVTGLRREDLDATLDQATPGAGGVVVLPYLAPAGERAPFVDPYARGQFIGLSLESTREDLVRAVCEGIAYAVRDCLEAAGLGREGRVFLGGGGVRSVGWRQILADVLQRPLLMGRQPEPGARGAALAAMRAAGVRVDEVAWTQPEGVVEPRAEYASLYDEGFTFYRERTRAARDHWRGPGG
ncbi:MAG: FGGY-family carbohydrate kinase [Thermomicrobiales bacterium]